MYIPVFVGVKGIFFFHKRKCVSGTFCIPFIKPVPMLFMSYYTLMLPAPNGANGLDYFMKKSNITICIKRILFLSRSFLSLL